MQIEDVGTSLKEEERKRKKAKQIELSHDCLMSVIRTVFLFSDSHFLVLFTIRLESIQEKNNNDIVMQIVILLVRLEIFVSILTWSIQHFVHKNRK
jgi:uncharacterized protein YqhQ